MDNKKKEISYDEAIEMPYSYCFSKTENILIQKVLLEIKETFNARLVKICNDNAIGKIAICFQKNLKVQLIDENNLSASAKVCFEKDHMIVKTKEDQKKIKIDLSGLKHGFIKKQDDVQDFRVKVAPITEQQPSSNHASYGSDKKFKKASFAEKQSNHYQDDYWLYETSIEDIKEY